MNTENLSPRSQNLGFDRDTGLLIPQGYLEALRELHDLNHKSVVEREAYWRRYYELAIAAINQGLIPRTLRILGAELRPGITLMDLRMMINASFVENPPRCAEYRTITIRDCLQKGITFFSRQPRSFSER